MKRFIVPLLGALSLLAAAGCSSVTDTPSSTQNSVQVDATALPPTPSSAHYTLWFSYAAGKRSVGAPKVAHGDAAYARIGSFKVSASQQMTGVNGGGATFTIPSTVNPQLLIDAILTVEQDSTTDSLPGARLVAGDFEGTSSQGMVHMMMEGDDAFGDSLATIAPGSFFLDMPTTPDMTDFAGGIWLGSPQATGVYPGVTLPVLPSVDENKLWHYQTWLEHRTGAATPEYLSIGTFLDPAGTDNNSAGPGAGSLASQAYVLPGEDFATGTTRILNDGSYGVLVSLEPNGLQPTSPFLVLLRRDTIPTGTTRLQAVPLTALTARPMVTVTVQR